MCVFIIIIVVVGTIIFITQAGVICMHFVFLLLQWGRWLRLCWNSSICFWSLRDLCICLMAPCMLLWFYVYLQLLVDHANFRFGSWYVRLDSWFNSDRIWWLCDNWSIRLWLVFFSCSVIIFKSWLESTSRNKYAMVNDWEKNLFLFLIFYYFFYWAITLQVHLDYNVPLMCVTSFETTRKPK